MKILYRLFTAFLILSSLCTKANTYTVTITTGNDWSRAVGSFLWALDQANLNPGRDVIDFNLASSLVVLGEAWGTNANFTDEVYINGTSLVDNGSIQIQNIRLAFPSSANGSHINNLTSISSVSAGYNIYITGNNDTINGCTLSNLGGKDAHAILIENSGSGSYIVGTDISSQGHCVSFNGTATSNTIYNSTMTSSLNNTVMFWAGGNNVKKCTITNSGINGIGIIASNNLVDSCSISANTEAGIIIENGNNNTLTNNEIFDNTYEGIGIQGTSSGNVIDNCLVHGNNKSFNMNANACSLPLIEQAGIKSNGGNTTIQNSFIYNNGANGILLYDNGIVGGGANSGQGTNSSISNNVIGRDNSGTESGNGWNGIFIWGANSATIDGNVIVNNGKGASHATYLCSSNPAMPDRISGIRFQQTSSGTINDNYIGTDASKTNAPNEFDGITLHTTVSSITVTGNTICYNGTNPTYSSYGKGGGIALRNTVNNCNIQGNYIGMHQDLTDGGNFDYGVSIELGTNNSIGGTGANEGNFIGYTKNTGTYYTLGTATPTDHGVGIWLVLAGNTDNQVYNNTITANAQHGILTERGANGNTIGGVGANEGNIISANGGHGILVQENGTSPTNKNTLRGNSFSCNNGRGITLSSNGNDLFGGIGATKTVTVNLSEARPTFVSGTAPALAVVDIYAPDNACARACSSDSAQGATYSASVTADASGFWEYDFSADANGVNNSNVIVMATEDATAGSSNSSEFSVCRINCVQPQNLVINSADTDICPGESATLTANSTGLLAGGDYYYTWFKNKNMDVDSIVKGPSVNDSTITVTAGGNYYVYIAHNNDSTCSDSIGPRTVTLNPSPELSLTPNSPSFCTGGNVTLTADTSGTLASNVSILWNDGSTADQLNVTAAGTYDVTVTNNTTGCTASASVTVTENSLPNPTVDDVSFCKGDSSLLDAGVSGMTYLWTPNNETTQTIYAKIDGNYSVTVTDPSSGCSSSKTIFADESPADKPTVSLSSDTNSICDNKISDIANLSASISAGLPYTITWSTNQTTDASIIVEDTGVFWVLVTDSFNCAGRDTIEITNYCKPPDPQVPNVITPENPNWTPFGEIDPSDLLVSHFEVYNRWGRIMYETDEILPVWNGYYGGGKASTGVYFWLWSYQDVTGEEHKMNGFLEIIEVK